MGPNNRRAQERAAQERNVPSRARFSKGPPKKNGGRGGGRGGGDRGDDRGDEGRGRGGRGGRGGRNNDAVIQKIQNRLAQQQRKDIGGISIAKSKQAATAESSSDARIASFSRKSKHALDRIDVNKLDTITLSAESVAIVERLLRAYNVWEGGEDENENEGEDEKKSEAEDVDNEMDVDDSAVGSSGLEEDVEEREHSYGMESDTLDKVEAKNSFGVDLVDETYDDYQGDYDDEPDYQSRNDGINFDKEGLNDNFSDEDSSQGSDISEDGKMHDNVNTDEEDLIDSPIYRHLTQHFSFQHQEVVLSLRASHKRLRLAKKKAQAEDGAMIESKDEKEIAKEDEGALLEMAMDWLSLHLKESDLRKGFRVQKIPTTKPKSMLLGPSTERTLSQEALHIRAVPHESISIMPKLTQLQYEKEEKESIFQLKRQNLSTDLIRIGFHLKEINQVFESMNIENMLELHMEKDDDNLLPLLMKHIIACVEAENNEEDASTLDQEIEGEMAELSIMERDQEKEVLEAIYAEGFQLLSDFSEGSEYLHYRVEVDPTTPSTHPACNEKCHLHVITRDGYPLTSPPMLWFTNTTLLPPTLLRRISINLKNKATEYIGQAAVYDLMEYVAEELPGWQKEFIDEEALAEKTSEENAKDQDDGIGSDEDEIDFYTQTFTAEEIKKLSRRQRQKYRAAQKSHARDAKLLEKQHEKLAKDEARRERVRIENQTISSRMSERVVQRRWKEWVEEEAEKAARRAMNDAFLRDEGRDKAREAADAARKEMLIFHGELEEECVDEKKEDQHQFKATESKTDEGDHEAAADSTNPRSVNAVITEAGEDVTKLQQQAANSEATPKTLLFVEKLRRMYEAKALEKAEGTNDDESKFGALHLTDAESKTDNTDAMDQSAKPHVPAPVVAPSPGIKDVLKDLIQTQTDQPWLVAPEARVPTVDEVSSKGRSIDNSRMQKTSNQLKNELERKYESARGGGRQNFRHSNKRRGGGPGKEFQGMLEQRSKLPAYKMRDELLSIIHNNQIAVVSGDTGCGKTTQIPQLVLDDYILNNRGAEVNIIVTQPRRISAIGVSERIAAERCEPNGQTVGYSIRLDSKRSNKTRLLLCTTGVLLRRLQCDPDMASVSHIFVDEVHERDLNTDFLLIILKDLLQRRPSLKLVLMSATLNAERFSNYFGGAPTCSIPGRAQPVKEYRLEDALECTNHLILQGSDYAKKSTSGGRKSTSGGGNDSDISISKTTLKRLYPNYSKHVIDSLAVVDESIINYELIAELLKYISTELEEGAILVFLSGMKEITAAMEALSKIEHFRDSSNAVILPLHSSLSNAEQTAIFQKPPKGKRKIVLSTNIAETSITIDDVVFVVDAGRVKENRYDDLNKMPTLAECWASKAATKQRRGRAGRVKPGYCWHLYSSHTNDRILDDYQLPEMLRVGLEDLVLQILVLDLGEPSKFLMKAVDPPTNLAISGALQLLESLGAAECEWDEHRTKIEKDDTEGLAVSTSLTALGYHLATLPVHPRVGKLLIYGSLFGVYEESLIIAAAMTSRSPFVSSFDNRDAADEAKREFSSDSDHLSVLLAFNQWSQLKRSDGRKAKAFLRDNFLSYYALSNIIQLKKQLVKYMSDIGFAPSTHQINDAGDLHLVRAVIAAGLYPNIVIAPRSLSGKTAGEVAFRGQQNGEIYLHPSTIAFKAKALDSRYGCYHEIIKTSKIYIRDCTAVSKFAILLFGGALSVYQTHGVVTVDHWLKFKVDAKPATLVKYLRSSMEALLLEKILNPTIEVAESPKGRAVIEAVATLLKMEGGK